MATPSMDLEIPSWKLEGKEADKFKREAVDHATKLGLSRSGAEKFAEIFIRATCVADEEFGTEDD